MPKSSKKSSPIGENKEVVRVTFRLHGAELAQIREVRDMLSLNSELDAARYLMQRGLEVLSATLASRKASEKMAAQVTPEAIVKHMLPGIIQAEKEEEQRRTSAG